MCKRINMNLYSFGAATHYVVIHVIVVYHALGLTPLCSNWWWWAPMQIHNVQYPYNVCWINMEMKWYEIGVGSHFCVGLCAMRANGSWIIIIIIINKTAAPSPFIFRALFSILRDIRAVTQWNIICLFFFVLLLRTNGFQSLSCIHRMRDHGESEWMYEI